MVTERKTQEPGIVEIPYPEFESDRIDDLLLVWEGSSQDMVAGLQSNFRYPRDGHMLLDLAFLPYQNDIWLKEFTVLPEPRQILDQDHYYLGKISSVVIYEDEGKVTFFSKDKRSWLEISNKGRTLVLQQHQNRTDKTVRVNLP